MTPELPTLYQQIIHKSRYARWLDKEGRRETWPETVHRYISYFESEVANSPEGAAAFAKVKQELQDSILTLKVMPSMRALMTAGPALKRDAMAGYNCSYLAIDNARAFDEVMYVLMCGTGVGYSVERQCISKLPEIAEEFYATDTTITVHDSKIGWAKALRELISLLYAGQIPTWDTSRVRPSGARLKTFGGRASGPAPLIALFEFAVRLFKDAAGRKLTSIECHDLLCMIADTVVVGGVRRSAMICLSNLSDDRMRNAKTGRWYETNPHRQLANNSAVYEERPDMQIFLEEWKSLYESHAGERGIFNRQGVKKIVEALGRRETGYSFGTNPCSEIILRPMGLCNLSEAVVRTGDTLSDLKAKVRVAAILGTLQATQTNFRYVRKAWTRNAEEERLLGVSLTGLMDHEELSQVSETAKLWLSELREEVLAVNREWSAYLGIAQAAATTAVKPSGSVSQLVDCASGLHARYSKQYIRRIRGDAKDPLSSFLINSGVPCEPAVGKPEVQVFSFPIKSPDTSVTEGNRSALAQLEYWRMLQEHWCEHKPSCTVYYKEEEFLGVGDWIYKNFDRISGIAFLPYSDHVYQQAPYEPVELDHYHTLNQEIPKQLDWTEFATYENTDNTSGSQTYACSAGVCEVVDITD